MGNSSTGKMIDGIQDLFQLGTRMNEVNWQSRYEADDTPWDKGQSHPMIDYWVEKIEVKGAIVVPGCGRGWDLRAWAETHPSSQVIGIDLAPAAVQSARELCADLPNVTVHEADFFALADWHQGQCIGLIWEHTCFCAIPPQLRDAYVETVTALLHPAGLLIGAFFTDMDDGGAGPPWNATMAEMEQRFSPHFQIEHPVTEHRTFPGREGEERTILMRRL